MNMLPAEKPKSLQEYEEAYLRLTWYELRYLEEFNELSNTRTISLGGMGGALIGHITYQEIYAFLSLGMSSLQDPVNVYVKVIKAIDAEYVVMKQKKLDDESAKASKSSKTGKDSKKFIGAPATSQAKPLPHNID